MTGIGRPTSTRNGLFFEKGTLMGRTLMATAIKGGCCLTAVNGYTSKVFTGVAKVAEGGGG